MTGGHLTPHDAVLLKRIAAAIEAGDEPSVHDRQAAAETLRPKARPGQRSLSTQIAQAEHQRLLRVMAATFYAGQSANSAADGMAHLLARYRDGSDWKRDRAAADIPYRETRRGHCWAVLKIWDRALSARRIRALLAMSSGDFMANERGHGQGRDRPEGGSTDG